MIINFQDTPRVMIVEARYYEEISDNLMKGATQVLEENDVEYDSYTVPGALEIPALIKYAIRALSFNIHMERYDAYIALGCVIRGETGHYDIVANESAHALMNIGQQYSLAIGNGILTVENEDQALVRSDPAQKNKGGEAATAALEMLMQKQKFGLFPRQKK